MAINVNAHVAAKAGGSRGSSWLQLLTPSFLLLWLIAQIAVLVGVVWWRVTQPSTYQSGLLFGVLPLSVPWAGALGGCTEGVVALLGHWRLWGSNPDQGNSWNAWYLVRAPVAAILGSVAVGIVTLFLHTIDTGAASSGGLFFTPPGKFSLAIVAFAIGYHNRAFDSLFTRLMQTVLGESAPGAQSLVSATDLLNVGDVAKGSVRVRAVTVTNGGKADLDLRQPLEAIVGTDAERFAILAPPASIAGGTSADFRIQFTPDAVRVFSAGLAINPQTTILLEGKGT